MPTGLPNLHDLWDYQNPAHTEQTFRDLLPAAQASGDRSYHLQLLTQIARAQCLQKHYDAAHATLDRVRDALTDDLPLVRVRYLLERGRTFNDTLRADEAKAAFLESWDLARQHRFDEFAVDAAHMMGVMPPPEQALEWNLRAVEYAKASHDPQARRWLGTLQNNIGWTYHNMGRHQDALAVFQDALKFRIEQGKPGPIRIARWCIAKTQRLLGDPQTALTTQQQLFREITLAGEQDGYIHEELAECLLALNKPNEAQPHFAQAYALLSKDPWFPPTEKPRLERLKHLST